LRLQRPSRPAAVLADLCGGREERAAGRAPSGRGGSGNLRPADRGRLSFDLLRVAHEPLAGVHGPHRLAGGWGRLSAVSGLEGRPDGGWGWMDAAPDVADGQELQGSAPAGALADRDAERRYPPPRPPDDAADRGAGGPDASAPDLRDARERPHAPLL